MQFNLFCYVKPCSNLVYRYQCFGEKEYHPLQGRRVAAPEKVLWCREWRTKTVAKSSHFPTSLTVYTRRLTLLPWSWRQQLPWKHWCLCTQLHGVTSYKTKQHILPKLKCQFNLNWENFKCLNFFQESLLTAASYLNNYSKGNVIPVF
jgi:hypothetical protein